MICFATHKQNFDTDTQKIHIFLSTLIISDPDNPKHVKITWILRLITNEI